MEHHDVAIEWFAAEGNQGWVTCAVTELGVIRVRAQLPGGPWPPAHGIGKKEFKRKKYLD